MGFCLRRAAGRAQGVVLVLFAVLGRPAAAGDAQAGHDVFRSECAECHSPLPGRNKKGPSLFGIVGRHAGSMQGYHYSEALKTASWVWTPDVLRTYLSQSARKANPGTKMKYDGLNDSKQLDDLITFLGTLH